MSKELFQVTPQHLRTLVLDYLCHHSYTETARAFARDSAVRSSELGSDVHMSGPSEEYLSEEVIKLVQLRREIKLHILSGRVAEATALLNEHFPTVLDESESSDVLMSSRNSTPVKEPRLHQDIPYTSQTSVNPTHLSLNLKILAFIEATRTVALEYPPKPDSIPATLPHLQDIGAKEKHQITLLHRAQKLFSEVQSLQNPKDKEIYLKELRHVGGLLAYVNPEDSTLAKYLSQERREAVADQINSAILYRLNHPAVSHLELYSRYTYSLWSLMHDMEVPLPPLTNRPPGLPRGLFVPQTHMDTVPVKGSSGPEKEKETPEIVPVFDLREFANSQ